MLLFQSGKHIYIVLMKVKDLNLLHIMHFKGYVQVKMDQHFCNTPIFLHLCGL
jgi:hypothetical protein